MLTAKQPPHCGYKSVHDLPTPPSTSRSSPPLLYHEDLSKRSAQSIPRTATPAAAGQPMSGHHRGLPPPAALTQPPHGHAPPPPPSAAPHLGQPQPPAQPHPPPQQPPLLGQLPAPPQWQQGADEAMRAWLLAKTEEEKRRQEEEKTRQESLRLEQLRTGHDIIRTSLQGQIPPPMVPIVFAGMAGGAISQAALEWVQQFMYSQMQPPPHQAQLTASSSGQVSPEHRRDSQPQSYGYQPPVGVPPTPALGQGPPHGAYPSQPPTSPLGRSRGWTMPPGYGPAPRASNLPALNINVPQGGPGPQTSHTSAARAQAQSEQAQSSPSIQFQMWKPPASEAGSGSNVAATPSERYSLVGESPRKRKATGPQPGPPPPSAQQRIMSPPPFPQSSSTLSHPPTGRRRGGHSRQRSDISGYRESGRGSRPEQAESAYRGASPTRSSAPVTAREGEIIGDPARQQMEHQPGFQQQQQAPPPRTAPQSVSSLLSEEPSPRNIQYHHEGERRG